MLGTEWNKLVISGAAPCGRVGHRMEYLPLSQALIVVGGRNDEMCKNLSIPFLNDIYLFLLEQKAWIQAVYIPKSEQLYSICNHSMCVYVDPEKQYQRVLIFGGISNYFHPEQSCLTNKVF